MTETRSVRPPEPLVLREYTTYDEAQRLVDGLSDAGFPVERVRIIGHDMYSVEQVTGRLTKGRAALPGAGGGAWWGLLIGLLLALFAANASGVITVLALGLVIGAIWGAVFGFVAQWAPVAAVTSPASRTWSRGATPSRSTPATSMKPSKSRTAFEPDHARNQRPIAGRGLCDSRCQPTIASPHDTPSPYCSPIRPASEPSWTLPVPGPGRWKR